MRLLIIDQDPRSSKNLSRILADDYVVDATNTGEKGEHLAYANNYDAILMELVLPDIDGEELCTLIKSRLKSTPVIIVTKLSTIADKERAFDSGADDYIVKPVNSRELKARLKASIRKLPRVESLKILSVRELSLDLNRRLVMYKTHRIDLRKKEMQLLEFLMINTGRVVTRIEILENVWDMNTNPFTNTVEVHLKRLRDKIEKPYNESFISTVHGIGYIME